MKTHKFLLTLGLALAGVTAIAEGVAWKNLDAEHRKGGRKVSAGYLAGKVVLVCRDVSAAGRMEEVWSSFKCKPFVLVGSFDAAAANASYPVYAGAGLAEGEPRDPFYVVGPTGKIVYRGGDERQCEEDLVGAIADLESPKNLAAWKEILDFEARHLPAQATLRLAQFKKRFPKESKYAAEVAKQLAAVPEAKKVAELVAASRKLKDRKAASPKKEKAARAKAEKAIDAALSKYAKLKECTEPRVAQEAKNALADLTWAKADL